MANVFIADSESTSIDEHIIDKVKNYLLEEGQQCTEVNTGYYINAQMSGHFIDFVILGDRETENCVRVTEFFIQLLRSHKLHANDRVAILSSVDELVCLQLVLAATNKQVVGEFDVDTCQVLGLHDQIVRSKLALNSCNTDTYSHDTKLEAISLSYKTFLQDSNVIDLADVYLAIQLAHKTNAELMERLTRTNLLILNPQFHSIVEKTMMLFLIGGKKSHRVTLCLPLDESFGPHLCMSRVEVNIESCLSDENLFISSTDARRNYAPSSCAKKSTTELYLEQVFLGYLRLLLNSRDELSLARVINVPSRGLDHRAFTDVKHEAKKRGLSMYQTLTSYVMRIRLGGKGYAPNTDCLLLTHTKGLAEFTDLMQKLQTIVEEDINVGSALGRLVTVIKNCLLKSTEPQLRRTSVESVAIKFSEEAASLSLNSKLPHVCGTMSGYATLQAIRSMLDRRAVIPLPDDGSCVLSDTESSQKTPIRFTSLLSVFRSPEEDVEVTKLSVEKSQNRKRPLAKSHTNSQYQSCMDWAPNNTWSNAGPLTITDFVPSKTLVAAGVTTSARRLVTPCDGKENTPNTATTEETISPPTVPSVIERQNIKATVNPAKTSKSTATIGKGTSKTVGKSRATLGKSKVIKLEKGQRQLSSFFRV